MPTSSVGKGPLRPFRVFPAPQCSLAGTVISGTRKVPSCPLGSPCDWCAGRQSGLGGPQMKLDELHSDQKCPEPLASVGTLFIHQNFITPKFLTQLSSRHRGGPRGLNQISWWGYPGGPYDEAITTPHVTGGREAREGIPQTAQGEEES